MYKTKPGVYRMFNLLSGNSYVGSSKSVSMRISSHGTRLKSGYKDNVRIRKDLELYGIDSFKFEVLEYCDEPSMKDREQYYFDLIKPFYNAWPTVYSAKGRSYTQEQLKSFIGIKRSPFKDKKSRSAKMKLAWEKRKLRPDYKDWIENLRKMKTGKKFSEELKNKLSLSRRGRIVSQETRNKISRARLGWKRDFINNSWIKNEKNK